MELLTIAIDELKLDPNNARKHSARNISAIASSLDKFGQRKPVVVWHNTVIAGNGTIEAAKTLGWREISIVKVPNEWDLETAKAYALADNRSSELAEWDTGVLSEQLALLDEMGWDIESLGFVTIDQTVNAQAEWENMPDYEQPNKIAPFHCTIHFATEDDVEAFFRLIDRPKKSSFWYPEGDGLVGTDASKQYVSEA